MIKCETVKMGDDWKLRIITNTFPDRNVDCKWTAYIYKGKEKTMLMFGCDPQGYYTTTERFKELAIGNFENYKDIYRDYIGGLENA